MRHRLSSLPFFHECLTFSTLWLVGNLVLLSAQAIAEPQIRDVTQATQKQDHALQCPDGAILFGAGPPQGFEAWCAKPAAQAGAAPIYHGPRVLWYGNGQKLAEGEYQNGKQRGVATAWHQNGQKRIVEHFDQGMRHGLSTAWYPDGTKQGEGRFEHGKEEGPWSWWHANGKKAVNGEFQAGQRFGVWTYWNPDGSFKATENYSASTESKPIPMK